MAEPLSYEADVVDRGDAVTKLTTVSTVPTTTNVTVGETLVAPEAAAGGSSDNPQPTEDATVDGSGSVSSDEFDAKALRDIEDEGLSEDGQDEVSASVAQPDGAALEDPVVEAPVEPEPVVDNSGGDTQTAETFTEGDSGDVIPEVIVAETSAASETAVGVTDDSESTDGSGCKISKV